MKKIALIILGLSLFSISWAQNITTSIPLAGNAYKTDGGGRINVGDEGIVNWRIPGTFSLFFHLSRPETLELALKAKGHSQILLQFEQETLPVILDSNEYSVVPVGKIRVSKAGYVRIDIHSVSKEDEKGTFGEISDLVVTNRKGKLIYVRTLPRKTGMTGPDLFLNYRLPEEAEWFYSEMTVPEEGEQPGCYYAANGFDCGYVGLFGSAPSRKFVVFNIWNPDVKPSERVVSSESRIKLLHKGNEVTQEEGLQRHEESCKLLYNWQAGETYRFLTRIYPDEAGNTVYSAYFYHPEEQEWQLIATYLRPTPYTGYTYCFSMLKNMFAEIGYRPRSMNTNNTWALTTQGEWKEITEVIFTTNIPNILKNRLDFKGGVNEATNGLFLKSGGFFDDFTPEGSVFHRKPGGSPESLPDIEAIKQL